MALVPNIPQRAELVSCSFHLSDDPTDNMNATLSVSIDECRFEPRGDGHGASVLLHVAFSLTDSKNDGDERMNMTAYAKGNAIDSTEREAAHDAAASAYVVAMSAANVIVSLSPAHGMPLPPIDVRGAVDKYMEGDRG